MVQTSTDAVIDHLEFYVSDAAARAEEFVTRYDFRLVATAGDPTTGDACSLVVRRHDIVFVLTQGLADDHPASGYVLTHGDGVAHVALRVPDAAAALRTALANGGRPLGDGIAAFGDVVHTFVERPEGAPWSRPGFVPHPAADQQPCAGDGVTSVDHLAVCLEGGRLAPTVESYRQVLGWATIFEENIHVGAQAMRSMVVQSPNGQVTLTLLEPVPDAQPGQIDDFLKSHGGAGVQHIAFTVADIRQAFDDLSRRGVRFLETPGAYYSDLTSRLAHLAHPVETLEQRGILADQDHDGQLFQIFTRSEHPRKTLFMELIERQGARTFGSNNIRRLYEAVEREQSAAPRTTPAS